MTSRSMGAVGQRDPSRAPDRRAVPPAAASGSPKDCRGRSGLPRAAWSSDTRWYACSPGPRALPGPSPSMRWSWSPTRTRHSVPSAPAARTVRCTSPPSIGSSRNCREAATTSCGSTTPANPTPSPKATSPRPRGSATDLDLPVDRHPRGPVDRGPAPQPPRRPASRRRTPPAVRSRPRFRACLTIVRSPRRTTGRTPDPDLDVSWPRPPGPARLRTS